MVPPPEVRSYVPKQCLSKKKKKNPNNNFITGNFITWVSASLLFYKHLLASTSAPWSPQQRQWTVSTGVIKVSFKSNKLVFILLDIVRQQYHEMVSHRGANEGQARVLLMFPSNSALYTLPKHSGNAGVRNSFHLKKQFRSPRQMASDLISVSWNTNKNKGEQKGGDRNRLSRLRTFFNKVKQKRDVQKVREIEMYEAD